MTKLFHELIIDEIKRRKKSPSHSLRRVLSSACWWKLETPAQLYQCSFPNSLSAAPSYCIWCHSFSLWLGWEFKIKTNCSQKSQIEGGLSCLEARQAQAFLDENIVCFFYRTQLWLIAFHPYLDFVFSRDTFSDAGGLWSMLGVPYKHANGPLFRGHKGPPGGDQLTLNTESLPGPRIMNFIGFSWCRIWYTGLKKVSSFFIIKSHLFCYKPLLKLTTHLIPGCSVTPCWNSVTQLQEGG